MVDQRPVAGLRKARIMSEMSKTPLAVDPAWAGAVVFTIGHSTRSQEAFIELLKAHDVKTLVDVRTVPRSRRNPQFNSDELAASLPRAGIAYVHLAELGGLRRGLGAASPNTGWRNASFRGYADYMQTAEFRHGLERLCELKNAGAMALMCAEAVPWRCHRSLIADALLVRGVASEDIQGLDRTIPHKLTPFAHLEGRTITYPGPTASTSDRTSE
jgi:uncharacterized protein (DUF488 family)